jgi:hypothetical protein
MRNDGALAIWWNTTAFDVPWIHAQHLHIAHYCETNPKPAARLGDTEAIRLAGLTGLEVARRQMRWSRTVPLDTHLANIGSRSAFLVLGESRRRACLAEDTGCSALHSQRASSRRRTWLICWWAVSPVEDADTSMRLPRWQEWTPELR